jgi:hypothetical protein
MSYIFVGSCFVSCITIKWHTYPSWVFTINESVEIRFGKKIDSEDGQRTHIDVSVQSP